MTPKKRFPYYDSDLRLNAETLLTLAGLFHESSTARSYKIYCVDHVCGRAVYDRGYITIPLWAIQRPHGPGYLKWYISHEFAHVFNYHYTKERNHGAGFMEWLKRICPMEFQHFETDYKPSLAAAAGITSKRQDALLQSFRK